MNATDSPAEPARACHYCGRTGEPLAPCCDGHPDWMACLDVRDCRNALLAVLEAQRAAEGAQP